MSWTLTASSRPVPAHPARTRRTRDDTRTRPPRRPLELAKRPRANSALDARRRKRTEEPARAPAEGISEQAIRASEPLELAERSIADRDHRPSRRPSAPRAVSPQRANAGSQGVSVLVCAELDEVGRVRADIERRVEQLAVELLALATATATWDGPAEPTCMRLGCSRASDVRCARASRAVACRLIRTSYSG